jgi:general secretion pathway protein B
MSYILEALKKAQAERELGSAPTIHAAGVQAAPPRAASNRTPLLIGLGVGAAIAAVAAFALLRQPAPPPAVVAVATAPAVVAPVVPVLPPEPVAATVKPAPPKPKPKPMEPAPAPAPEPAPAVAAAPAPVDDDAPLVGQLPENIQREIPPVVFGGYMYSSNPADRLVLIDKVLRREGEQIAPGLTLERLLPKGAVMNYRGYRYRVPY